jgi:two-component system, NtrC family, nitrogen regulation response regulator NtrX
VLFRSKLLRVLQDQEFERLGGTQTLKVDFRLIAATNRDLAESVRGNEFRSDLYYRLNVFPIRLPPLRERRDDIPLLVSHFVASLTQREGVSPRAIAPEAVDRLAALDWPGNVRELRNTIERLLILASAPRVTVDDVERLAGGRNQDLDAPAALLASRTFEEFKHTSERAFLLAKLREYDWNVSETARLLEMPRSNLYKKIERYGLSRETSH